MELLIGAFSSPPRFAAGRTHAALRDRREGLHDWSFRIVLFLLCALKGTETRNRTALAHKRKENVTTRSCSFFYDRIRFLVFFSKKQTWFQIVVQQIMINAGFALWSINRLPKRALVGVGYTCLLL